MPRRPLKQRKTVRLRKTVPRASVHCLWSALFVPYFEFCATEPRGNFGRISQHIGVFAPRTRQQAHHKPHHTLGIRAAIQCHQCTRATTSPYKRCDDASAQDVLPTLPAVQRQQSSCRRRVSKCTHNLLTISVSGLPCLFCKTTAHSPHPKTCATAHIGDTPACKATRRAASASHRARRLCPSTGVESQDAALWPQPTSHDLLPPSPGDSTTHDLLPPSPGDSTTRQVSTHLVVVVAAVGTAIERCGSCSLVWCALDVLCLWPFLSRAFASPQLYAACHIPRSVRTDSWPTYR